MKCAFNHATSRLVHTLLIGAAVFVAFLAAASAAPFQVTGVVARVADGDTLTVCDTGLSQV